MTRIFLGLLILLCAVPAIQGSAGAPAPTTIHLAPYSLGDTLTIQAQVNGHSGIFLFDTGGGVSVITPQFAKAIGCVPWGRITGFRMTGEKLMFPHCDNLQFNAAGQTLLAPSVGIFDIMGLLPPNAQHLDGSLGLDIFAGKTVTYDWPDRLLIVETPSSLHARIRNAKEIPVRIVRDAQGVALTIDAGVPTASGTAWMELDSGNNGPYFVADYLAPLFHLDPGKKGPQPVKFDIAGGIPVTGMAVTRNAIMDGNIGARFFQNWVLTVDLASGRAWLAPHSTP